MINIIDTSRLSDKQTRLDRLALLLSRHIAVAGQAEDLRSPLCSVVASINPATPPQRGKSIKQQLQIQLRSSCLCCSAGAADADVDPAAVAMLGHQALPPHVQAVYTLQNSELNSISKVGCPPACMYIDL
jgi:hypothetical protein